MAIKTDSDARKNAKYLDELDGIAERDVAELRRKDKEYGGSWRKRGGTGAFHAFIRKIDRLETQVSKVNYDVFLAIQHDTRAEGVLDDIRDARRYLALIEAEMVARGVVKVEV